MLLLLLTAVPLSEPAAVPLSEPGDSIGLDGARGDGALLLFLHTYATIPTMTVQIQKRIKTVSYTHLTLPTKA